jgi:hypothetical protein
MNRSGERHFQIASEICSLDSCDFGKYKKYVTGEKKKKFLKKKASKAFLF